MYVLAFGAHDPILSQMYQQHWAIIPNLAIDLVLPEMLKLLPIYLAGRVVLGMTLLLPLVGAIAYHRVAFGVRSYWPLAAALTAYNALFIFGFMNFQLSLGVALLVAAGWRRWRTHHPLLMALCGAVATTAMFFIHIFGLLFLAVLLGTEEFACLWRNRSDGRTLQDRLWRHGLIGLVAFVPPVALYALAPLSRAGGDVVWLPWWHKLLWLAEPFMAYDGPIDWLAAILFLILLHALWQFGRLRAAPGVGGAVLVLLALYTVTPFVVRDTGFVDARFPVMIGLLAFAGICPVRLSPTIRLAVAVGLALTFVARTASLANVWNGHNQDVADMRRVISSVPAGAKVLVVSVDPEDAPDYWRALPRGREIPSYFRIDFHLPALLLIERQAFWPCLFTMPTQQPLALRPPYDRIGYPECQPPDWQSLAAGHSVHAVTPAPYLHDWQRNYDFVLLLNAGGAGDLRRFLPDRLALLAASDMAALYSIRGRDVGRRDAVRRDTVP